MDDIILKLSNVESMTNANEATRCEFISAILHASIAIAKNLTSQDIFIVLQKNISGEDATGRVDYTIKSLEEFLCITEGKPRNIKIGYAQVSLLILLVYCFNENNYSRRRSDKGRCILSLRIWRNLKVRSKQIRKNELRIKHLMKITLTIFMAL
jgi:hypothetical protein